MGKAKKTRKFAETKRIISKNDGRLKAKQVAAKADTFDISNHEQTPVGLWFKHNEALGPPYRVIVDTNFINFSIKNKIEMVRGMMDCLLAKCTPVILDSVMAELEKLGPKFRVALRVAKDKIFERLPCSHSGTYADDCLCDRVSQHRCFIVATNDKDLKRRIRKIPGVPIMYVANHRYTIEQLPDKVDGGAGQTTKF